MYQNNLNFTDCENMWSRYFKRVYAYIGFSTSYHMRVLLLIVTTVAFFFLTSCPSSQSAFPGMSTMTLTSESLPIYSQLRSATWWENGYWRNTSFRNTGPVLYKVALWVGKFSLRAAKVNFRKLDLAEKPNTLFSSPADPTLLSLDCICENTSCDSVQFAGLKLKKLLENTGPN